ncbi:MAG TPA: Lin1244/Lin1753 domain-containing protein [Clostridium sp.]
MKDAYYFSHDSNASQDPKILQMCSVYKAEGYGWYWMLIEMMREQENYKIPIQGKYVFNSLAIRLYTKVETFVQFIDDCVSEFKLFRKDENDLWSESLLKRMKIKDEKSLKAKKSIQTRWAKNQEKSTVKQNREYENDTNVSNNDTLKESKVKESKVKESREKEIKEQSCGSDFRNKDIYKFYEQCGFGLLNLTLTDLIDADVEFYTKEWLVDAMKEAVRQNKYKYGYVEGILRNWKTNGREEKRGEDSKCIEDPNREGIGFELGCD